MPGVWHWYLDMNEPKLTVVIRSCICYVFWMLVYIIISYTCTFVCMNSVWNGFMVVFSVARLMLCPQCILKILFILKLYTCERWFDLVGFDQCLFCKKHEASCRVGGSFCMKENQGGTVRVMGFLRHVNLIFAQLYAVFGDVDTDR